MLLDKSSDFHRGKIPAGKSSMVCVAVLPSVLANARFDNFDTVGVVWLIMGLFRAVLDSADSPYR
jgi:hypothetical protein